MGIHEDEFDTPTLLINLPTMEDNQRQMGECFRGGEVALRPHVKLHKATPALAYCQLAAVAIGLTCAKSAVAEELAGAGVHDLLIANQIFRERKIRRPVNLTAYTHVMVAMDDPENVRKLSWG